MIQLIHFVLFSFACKGNTFLRSAQKECGCRIMLYTLIPQHFDLTLFISS